MVPSGLRYAVNGHSLRCRFRAHEDALEAIEPALGCARRRSTSDDADKARFGVALEDVVRGVAVLSGAQHRLPLRKRPLPYARRKLAQRVVRELFQEFERPERIEWQRRSAGDRWRR